jgi:putative heme iron utilization protein
MWYKDLGQVNYLSSLTRYRPEKIESLISEKYGAYLQEIVTNLPNQFLYLMASEFALQEVTRAAII